MFYNTGDDEISYLSEKLDDKSLIEQFKFIGNEWFYGWESMKSYVGWKQVFNKLFQLSFLLWISRYLKFV